MLEAFFNSELVPQHLVFIRMFPIREKRFLLGWGFTRKERMLPKRWRKIRSYNRNSGNKWNHSIKPKHNQVHLHSFPLIFLTNTYTLEIAFSLTWKLSRIAYVQLTENDFCFLSFYSDHECVLEHRFRSLFNLSAFVN